MVDTREPPDGDFVAYVEKIEREQMARAMVPHRLQHVATGGKAGAEAAEGKARALTAAEAQKVLQALTARAGSEGVPRGALIGLVIGVAAIAVGLVAEGGFFFVILGAVFVWHNLRKLLKGARPAAGPAQQVAQTFGRAAPGQARKRDK